MVCTNKMGNTGISLAKNHTTNACNCRNVERICKTGFKEPTTKCSMQENCIKIAEEIFTLCSPWIHSVCVNPVQEVSGIFPERTAPNSFAVMWNSRPVEATHEKVSKTRMHQRELWLTNTESSNQLSDQGMITGEMTSAALKKLSRDEQRAAAWYVFQVHLY